MLHSIRNYYFFSLQKRGAESCLGATEIVVVDCTWINRKHAMLDQCHIFTHPHEQNALRQTVGL